MAKKAAAAAKPRTRTRHPSRKCATKRPAGRPSPKQPPPMTPAKKLQGGRMWLRGIPITHIAAALDVTEGTFRYHLAKTIKPAFADDFEASKSIEAAKVAELERIAWLKFEARPDVKWLDTVKWAIDWRSKVAGHYAAEKHEHNLKGDVDIRVAGLTPAELDKIAIDRLNRLRKERGEREERGKERGG